MFGFLINLPIVNYYEHGTYLTMNHGHGALFGVYGMLSIGLLLFSWLWLARDASFFSRDLVHFIGTVRVIPDLLIILLGVVPLLFFLVKTYPKLKAVEIKEGESVWERLGIEL